MYLAYKYAKKKYKERKQAKAAETAESPSSDAQPAVQQDAMASDQIKNAARSEDETAEKGEEKAESTSPESHETPQDDSIEKKRKRSYRLKIIFGLVAPFTLQSLDTTIIASALPFIAKDFSTSSLTPTFSNVVADPTTR